MKNHISTAFRSLPQLHQIAGYPSSAWLFVFHENDVESGFSNSPPIND